jgi:hypothetical protein
VRGEEHLERDDELRNIDEPLAAITEAYSPTWNLTTRMYPDTAAFLLKAMLGAPVTTAGNGVITDPDAATIPAGAFRHVFTAPFGPSGPSPQTTEWIAAYRDQGVYYRMKGAGLSSLSIEMPERGGVRMQASGPALYMPAPISDPALTPVYESLGVHPFKGGDFTIPTWLSGTAPCEKSGFTLQFTNEMTPRPDCGVTSEFPAGLDKGDSSVMLVGSIPKRLIDVDDDVALMNATGFATKTRWVSKSIIASAYPYKMFVETTNSQYMSGGANALVNQRRIGGSFEWKATNATGSPGSVTITVVNATASYA